MGLFDAIASTVGNLTDNVVGMVQTNHQNKVNQRMMREQNAFNAEQAQMQRDWQESMWNKNNEYNSPEAMLERGLNPFLEGSAASRGSSAPASGGSAASASPAPSAQAFKPNFSGVFQSLATLASAKASDASAKYSRAMADQTDTVTPLLRDYYRSHTDWKNLGIGNSGYWTADAGRRSAALDQSIEAQELKNMQFAERISAAQETQILLNSDAQRTLNKYMDQQQQADLFIKAQTLVNLQINGALTEKQIQTEMQKAVLVGAQAAGQKISNKVAGETAESLIRASNAAYTLQYYDAKHDQQNLNIRKELEYSDKKAGIELKKYGAELTRKQARTQYWRDAAGILNSAASGAGNVIGAFMPKIHQLVK